MKIYTVVMAKASFSNPPTLDVFGSFMEEWKARSAMIDKIVDMAQKDSNFASALWTDENHPDIGEEVRKISKLDADPLFFRPNDDEKFPDAVCVAMRNYLNGEISNEEGSYHVYSDLAYDIDSMYRFEVAKNNLELEE